MSPMVRRLHARAGAGGPLFIAVEFDLVTRGAHGSADGFRRDQSRRGGEESRVHAQPLPRRLSATSRPRGARSAACRETLAGISWRPAGPPRATWGSKGPQQVVEPHGAAPARLHPRCTYIAHRACRCEGREGPRVVVRLAAQGPWREAGDRRLGNRPWLARGRERSRNYRRPRLAHRRDRAREDLTAMRPSRASFAMRPSRGRTS